MARVTTYIDDMSGETLEDVEPTTVTVDGKDYTVDLSEASKAHLINWLSGEGAYAPRTKSPSAPKAAVATNASVTRIRLTAEAKANFDKATNAYKADKHEKRVKMYEFAATTEAHADAKDSGKNIPGALIENFYAANPEAERYYGKTKTVEAPKNTDYVS